MLILAMLVLLAGCAAAPAAPAVQCRIVLESSPAFTAQTQTAAVTPGQTVTFTLTPADGYTLTGADYPGARLTRTGTGYTLSLPEVRYSTAVAVTAEKSDTVLYYRDNLGGDWIEAPVTASHLRVNTAIQGELFNNPGHTLTGWNTAPDGSGQAVGLGIEPDRARQPALCPVGCPERCRRIHLYRKQRHRHRHGLAGERGTPCHSRYAGRRASG